MHKDERELLDVLKFELEFLNKGGYGRSSRESWRPVYIFEDSPTCMNYDCKESPSPCSDCALMELVPPELRFGKAPCRRIQLNAAGETLDSLYRYADEHEIEETLRQWLVETIDSLEGRRKIPEGDGPGPLPLGSEAAKGTALHESDHPKCANPACGTSFAWLHGGKFFRFRGGAPLNANPPLGKPAGNAHGVRHFWLCERCAGVFTLVYDEKAGVVLKLLWLEPHFEDVAALLATPSRHKLT